MKISYRNHPVLEMISHGELKTLSVNPDDDQRISDEAWSEFKMLWKSNSAKFASDIKVLSNPFAEAIINSGEKLTTDELLTKTVLGDSCGTLIINGRTICYSFEYDGVAKSRLTYFLFHKNKTPYPELRCVMKTDFDAENSATNAEVYIAKNGIYKGNQQLTIQSLIGLLVATLNFIQFCEIEVKVLPPNSKVKHDKNKYVNETDSNIQYLNSTWFTTLVKTDGFKVRGHFRLQPKKKNDVWTKELIWISEYEKEGYTMPAKKLSRNIL